MWKENEFYQNKAIICNMKASKVDTSHCNQAIPKTNLKIHFLEICISNMNLIVCVCSKILLQSIQWEIKYPN